MRICGQEFSTSLLERIREVIASVPEISRRALSRKVCEWLDWRSANGALQEGGCRKALAELARRGAVELPAAARAIVRQPTCTVELKESAVALPLEALGTVSLVVVEAGSEDAKRWRALLDRHHYLGDKPLCGAQLRYLIRSAPYGDLGALAFTSASWALKARDKYIGWRESARRRNLQRVVSNARFLIRPGVDVPNLASHVLALAARQLPADWEARYGVRPVLLETFVDPTRFPGCCYRAANWQEIGETAGKRDGVAKLVFVYPLVPQWKEQLCREPAIVLGSAARPRAPANWAEEEFATARWHDKRLKDRLCTLVQDFFHRSQASIPEACEGKARTMAAYRFLNNREVDMQAILTPHTEATIERIRQHRIVLAPQDTTTLDYTHHPQTTGLGPINTRKDKTVGLVLHDTLALTLEGTPLGILDAQCWQRDPTTVRTGNERKKLPIEEKESHKWLQSFRKVAEVQKLCPDTLLVSMGDRESDVYELFHLAASDPQGPKLLIRAERSRQRKVDEQFLWDHLDAQPVAKEIELAVPRSTQRKARQADVALRFARVTLRPPAASSLPPVDVWAVYLLESSPPDEVEAIEWMLLTTVAVHTVEDAFERVRWYCLRWGIEVFHRTLKSGCRIEDRQLGTARRLQNCLAIDMVVAWRVYHLTMLGRELPNHPCSAFFEEVEWKALYCYHHKTTTTPEEPPTMAEAVRWLGALGGHLGRRRDGAPGTEVLWRGLQLLDMAVQMYLLFTAAAPPENWRSYPEGYLPFAQAP